MVNPDSNLYRTHPDWVLSFSNRERTEARSQLVLNLAREDVEEYVLGFLDKLVSTNDIAFLKWDYNRNWTEPGWDLSGAGAGAAKDPKEVYVRYVRNLYSILEELRHRHPALEIESSSGGGGRVDPGILTYVEEAWPSDNTDAVDRLTIQDGFLRAYAPQTMVAWVTDVSDIANKHSTTVEFRTVVAMQGALGVGGNLTKWSQADLDEEARLIAFYKEIRSTVQSGQVYRLTAPAPAQPTQIEYVSQDGSQAVVMAYEPHASYFLGYPRAFLQGLEQGATYRPRPLDAKKYTGPLEVQGAVLMNVGLSFNLYGDYDSTALVLERMAPSGEVRGQSKINPH